MKIVGKRQYATLFVSLIACPASVWAQDGAAAQEGSVPEEAGGSSEIIVTGTKRSSSLQDTPVAVTALGSCPPSGFNRQVGTCHAGCSYQVSFAHIVADLDALVVR